MKPIHEMSIQEAQEAAARRELNRRMGRPLDAPPIVTGLRTETPARPIGFTPPPVDRPAIEWPVTLLLPWSYLASDNAKYVARIAGTMEKPVPKLNLSPEYRRGKGLVHDAARTKLGLVEPAAIPLALHARVWVPDEIRAHDVPNFAKCVHDALEGVVYVKDRWLYRAVWERVGVDVDAPRCELRITPLLSSSSSPTRPAA